MTDYCLTFLKTNDYERFLITLFMPRKTRPMLWALYALNYEVAKTPQVVSDPTIGMIRLQWWREAIERLFNGKVDAHEVIRALHQTLQEGAVWQEQDFQGLIDAYEPALFKDQVFSFDELDQKLLEMSMKAVGEKQRQKLTRLFAYIAKYRADKKPDPLMPLKLWLSR